MKIIHKRYTNSITINPVGEDYNFEFKNVATAKFKINDNNINVLNIVVTTRRSYVSKILNHLNSIFTVHYVGATKIRGEACSIHNIKFISEGIEKCKVRIRFHCYRISST
jgi:hypothetical protein